MDAIQPNIQIQVCCCVFHIIDLNTSLVHTVTNVLLQSDTHLRLSCRTHRKHTRKCKPERLAVMGKGVHLHLKILTYTRPIILLNGVYEKAQDLAFTTQVARRRSDHPWWAPGVPIRILTTAGEYLYALVFLRQMLIAVLHGRIKNEVRGIIETFGHMVTG